MALFDKISVIYTRDLVGVLNHHLAYIHIIACGSAWGLWYNLSSNKGTTRAYSNVISGVPGLRELVTMTTTGRGGQWE